MNLNEYQQLAMRTAPKFKDPLDGIDNALYGLFGETAEVSEVIKKHKFQGHPLTDLDKENMIKEAGDIAWYLALLCKTLGTTLEEVCTINIHKLRKRYPGEGFEAERSVNRDGD